MKKLLLLILPLLAISFNSCSKEDDGEGNGGGNTSKLVKRITVENDYTVDFTYDNQQRITQMVWRDSYDNDETITTLTYTNNRVTISWSDDADEVFSLDNNGYVTREDYSNGRHQIHTYSNGNLSKTTFDFGDETGSITYTWDNGNMVKAVSEWQYDELSGENSYSYTYGNVENKLNINLFYGFYDVEELVFNGTSINNLPTSYTSSYETETYSYTYDDDGYPTKITTTQDGYSWNTTITYY